MAQDAFLVNPAKRRKRRVGRPRKRKATRKKRYARRGTARPRRKKRLGRVGSRHRPVVYNRGGRWRTSAKAKIARPGVFVNPGLAVVGNPPRRKRRRYSVKRRKSYRRNQPMTLRTFTGRVQNVLPLAVVGIASRIVTNMVPGMIGIVNPWARLGVKAAVGVLGGPMVGKMGQMVGGRTGGTVWTVVAMAEVVSDLVTQFMPGVIPGLGNYMDYNDQVGYGDSGASAFPEEVGAYPEEMNQYPYDGTHEYGY